MSTETETKPRQIFGHDWAVDFLRDIARPDAQGAYPQLRHAYLFTGETGLGKSTLARWLVQLLFCKADGRKPCGTCRDCRGLQTGNHPDFLLMEPVDSQGKANRQQGLLRVEQAAEIQHHVILRPFQSRHRVILIRDLQLAHESFLNKLLKTFEEPPRAVVLLGTVTDLSRLLPTLVSRCQMLPLKPVPPAGIEEALATRFAISPERAALLARLAHGRIGWAIAHRAEDALWESRREATELLTELIPASIVQRLGLADSLARKHQGDVGPVRAHVDFWAYWWRDVWLHQLSQANHCVNVDCIAEIKDTARRTQLAPVTNFLQRLEQAQLHLRHNVNVRVVLTNLVLHMPVLSRTA